MELGGQVDLIVFQVLLHAGDGVAAFITHAVAFGVVQRLGHLFGTGNVAQAIADVAQMAQGAGEMPFFDVCVQIAELATLHRFDEVGVVVTATFEIIHKLAIGTEGNATTIAITDDIAIGAHPNIADPCSLIMRRFQAAHFKDQFASFLGIIEQAQLRVGGLCRINISHPSAHTPDRIRQSLDVEAPAGFVHLVDTLVPQVAVARVPEPVPVVMDADAVQRFHRSGAAPEVKVQRIGYLQVSRRVADAATRFVAQAIRQLDGTDLAGMNEVHHLLHAFIRSALSTRLDDLVVLACHLDNASAFTDIVADRLFDIYIFAGLD